MKGYGDFPGGPVVKNLPCNARDVGSTPDEGTKIPHAVEQISLHATTTEAHTLWSPHTTTREPVGHSERSCMTQQRSCVSQLIPKAAK